MNSPTFNQRMSTPIRAVLISAIRSRTVCITICTFMVLCYLAGSAGYSRAESAEVQCRPTPTDSLGPFYEPDAPQRDSVGSGYPLRGVVRSAQTCLPIPKARIELWMAGPDGDYGDDYRATVYSTDTGIYRFESNYPKDYYGRPPHIHIRVSADGFKTLVTQHYPSPGTRQGEFDLVLLPQP